MPIDEQKIIDEELHPWEIGHETNPIEINPVIVRPTLDLTDQKRDMDYYLEPHKWLNNHNIARTINSGYIDTEQIYGWRPNKLKYRSGTYKNREDFRTAKQNAKHNKRMLKRAMRYAGSDQQSISDRHFYQSTLPTVVGIGTLGPTVGVYTVGNLLGAAIYTAPTWGPWVAKNIVLPWLGSKVVDGITHWTTGGKYNSFGDWLYNGTKLNEWTEGTWLETPTRFVTDMTNPGYWSPYSKISKSLFHSIPNWIDGKAYGYAGKVVGKQLFRNPTPKAWTAAENLTYMVPQQHRASFVQGVQKGNQEMYSLYNTTGGTKNTGEWFATGGMPNPQTTFYSGVPINPKNTFNVTDYIRDFSNRIRFYGITPSRIKSARSLRNLSNDLGIEIDMTGPWNWYNLNNISKELRGLSESIGSLRGKTLLPYTNVKFYDPVYNESYLGNDYKSLLNTVYKQMDHAEPWESLYVPEIRINKNRPTYFVDNSGQRIPDQYNEWINRGYDLLDPNRPMMGGKTYGEVKALNDKEYLLKLEEDAEIWYRGKQREAEIERNFNNFRTIVSERFEHPFLQQFVYNNPKYYYPLQQMKNDGLSEIEAYRRLIIERNTLYRAIGLYGNTLEEVTDPHKISKYALELTRDATNRSNPGTVGYQRILDEPNTGGIFFGDDYAGYGGPAFAYRRSDGAAQNVDANMKSSPLKYFNNIYVKLQPEKEFDFSGPIETWWDKNPTLPRTIENAPNQGYTFNTNLNGIPMFDADAQITRNIGKPVFIPRWKDNRIYNREQTVEGPVGTYIPFKIVDTHSAIGTLKSDYKNINWKDRSYNTLHEAYTDYRPILFEHGYVPYGFKYGGKLNKK